MVGQMQEELGETVAAVVAPEGVEAAVISSTRAAPGACVSGLLGFLVFLQGRDTSGFGHCQEP